MKAVDGNPRTPLVEWAEKGRITGANLPAALRLAGVFPAAADWRSFLDRLLLAMGTLLLAAGVIFFFAYNWNALHRFVRFGLVELPLAAALATVWVLGLERPGGRAALAGACVLVGVLFALIGQTYQTGADTFELFALWAALILPWAAVGRAPVIWALWLGLVNIAAVLYYQAFGGLFGLLFGDQQVLWALFAVNTLALAVWELLQMREPWRAHWRWGPRLLLTASGGLVTALVLDAILDWSGPVSGAAVPLWLLWLAAGHGFYRRIRLDAYALAVGVLSVVAVVAALLGRILFDAELHALGFLVIGLAVIGISAAGGAWIRRVLGEVRR